jgi:hypothetical protein
MSASTVHLSAPFPQTLPSLGGSVRTLVFVGRAENASAFILLDVLLSKGSVERLRTLRVLKLCVWHSHRNTFQFSSTIRRFSWKDMATASRGSEFFSFLAYAKRLQVHGVQLVDWTGFGPPVICKCA